MFYPEDEIQIDKVLEMLGPNSVIADGFGNVLFGANQGEAIEVPQEKDVDKEGFVYDTETKRLCCLLRTGGQDFMWVCTVTDTFEATKKLLKLIVALGETFFYNVAGQKNAFFKQLLLGGYQAVSPNEFQLYTNSLAELAQEFTVVRIEIVKSGNEDVQAQPLEECLSLVFPQQQGYCHARMDATTFAVICPLTEENTFKNVQATAENIGDTVMSELMLQAVVSVGGRVRTLKNLDMAYKSAERAGVIGNIFEIDDKCFSFDQLGASRLIYGQSKENCLAYLREVFGTQFIEERTKKTKPQEFTDELLNTIRVFLKLDQNVSEASRELYIHRNTLIYRIEKFNKITGLDCTKFEDGMKIQLGFMILKYILKTNG